MTIRYYIDPETDEPHVYRHNVSKSEVEDILHRPYEDRAGVDDSRVSVGQTRAGRYVRVIYVPDASSGSMFVITACELGPKARKALRRRRRRTQ